MPRREWENGYTVTNVNSQGDLNNEDEFPGGLTQAISLVDAESIERPATRQRLNGPSRRGHPTGPGSGSSVSEQIDLTQDDTVRQLFNDEADTPILPSQDARSGSTRDDKLPTLDELKTIAKRLIGMHCQPFVVSENNRIVVLAPRKQYHGLVLQLYVR